jgi:hypothetical protein
MFHLAAFLCVFATLRESNPTQQAVSRQAQSRQIRKSKTTEIDNHFQFAAYCELTS